MLPKATPTFKENPMIESSQVLTIEGLDPLDNHFARPDSKFAPPPEQVESTKRRCVSVKKMLKNYTKKKKTNYRLLLNHIIIIQNTLGVPKSIYILRSTTDAAEIPYLNSFLYHLKYIEYSDNMCYDLFKKIKKETI